MNTEKKFKKDRTFAMLAFLSVNIILYKLSYISIKSLVLLTYASGFYSQLISFDIKDKRIWAYIIVMLAIYVIVAILSK